MQLLEDLNIHSFIRISQIGLIMLIEWIVKKSKSSI